MIDQPTGRHDDLDRLTDEFRRMVAKLMQFRRHPDYQAALDRVFKLREDLCFEYEGRRAITDTNIALLFEAADHEFIEDIIRKEAFYGRR